jgi:hypothetical protein
MIELTLRRMIDPERALHAAATACESATTF